MYKEIFNEDFYIEMQFNELKEQNAVNIYLLKLAKKLKINTIITGDSHYTNNQDQKTHQTLLLINSKSTYNDLQKKRDGIDVDNGAWEFDTKELFLICPLFYKCVYCRNRHEINLYINNNEPHFLYIIFHLKKNREFVYNHYCTNNHIFIEQINKYNFTFISNIYFQIIKD